MTPPCLHFLLPRRRNVAESVLVDCWLEDYYFLFVLVGLLLLYYLIDDWRGVDDEWVDQYVELGVVVC